jgi:two-component system, OmpR family, sensor histidine kinase MtrB
MRTRLIVAFIVVALLTAVAAAWVINLIVPWYPWLGHLIATPRWLVHLLYSGQGPPKPRRGVPPIHVPTPPVALAFCLTMGGVLLAVIAGLAFAASRRVLRPVRRLAQAAQRMSGGDLSVRIEPKGHDELAQLVTTFNEMASALEDKVSELELMEARARQFAGDVSHELRTPLTAMTAVADILPGHPGLTGDAATAAQLVSQEIRHLNRLVHDLIEISRFDIGTAQLVTDDTEVAAAVAACRRSRGWTDVAIDIPDGLTMPLDRRRFDVILANLIGNALCHGGPPVTVQAGLRPADGGSQLALVVRDHGPGIPAEAMPHVFERFYKADTARSRSEGSGLGLAIACENTRLHGGSIEVANHPGGGAVFTLLLPISRPEPARGTQPDEEPVAVTRS